MKKEILTATREKLCELSSVIEKASEAAVFSVVGPREVVENIKEIEEILEI